MHGVAELVEIKRRVVPYTLDQRPVLSRIELSVFSFLAGAFFFYGLVIFEATEHSPDRRWRDAQHLAYLVRKKIVIVPQKHHPPKQVDAVRHALHGTDAFCRGRSRTAVVAKKETCTIDVAPEYDFCCVLFAVGGHLPRSKGCSANKIK